MKWLKTKETKKEIMELRLLMKMEPTAHSNQEKKANVGPK